MGLIISIIAATILFTGSDYYARKSVDSGKITTFKQAYSRGVWSGLIVVSISTFIGVLLG